MNTKSINSSFCPTKKKIPNRTVFTILWKFCFSFSECLFELDTPRCATYTSTYIHPCECEYVSFYRWRYVTTLLVRLRLPATLASPNPHNLFRWSHFVFSIHWKSRLRSIEHVSVCAYIENSIGSVHRRNRISQNSNNPNTAAVRRSLTHRETQLCVMWRAEQLNTDTHGHSNNNKIIYDRLSNVDYEAQNVFAMPFPLSLFGTRRTQSIALALPC